MSKGNFFKMFIKQPLVNASITPSSKRAARAIVRGLDLGQMKYVVELGPVLDGSLQLLDCYCSSSNGFSWYVLVYV